MPAKTYILCPGQGAQTVGMGHDFFDRSHNAREAFEVANGVLGFDLADLCFNGPEDRLNQTDMSQPAIYVTSVACYRAAVQNGVFEPTAVTAFAGLSLGEYTALHLAGVMTFEDGLRLVAARGRYMQAAATAVPSGMVALLGADPAAVDRLCAEAGQGDLLVPANYNAPGQIVVSGTAAACERAVKVAEAMGFKATPLKVAGAFHSAAMLPAATRMAAELLPATFADPTTPVYSNVTATRHGSGESIKSFLVQQIVSPVRWEQCMTAMIADGGPDARFVELAPNRHLAGLAKRINRRLPVENLSTVEALKAKGA